MTLVIDALDKFNNLSPETQDAIVKIGLALFALGPALKLLGGISTFASWVGGLSGVSAALAPIGTFFTATLIPAITSVGGAIFTFLISPIGLLILAIGALGLTIYYFGDDALKTLSMIGQIIGALVQRGIFEIGQLWQSLVDGAGQALSDLGQTISSAGSQAWNFVTQKAAGFKQTLAQTVTNAKALGTALAKAFTGGDKDGKQLAQTLNSIFGERLGGLINAQIQRLLGFKDAAVRAVQGVRSAFDGMVRYFSDLVNRIMTYARKFYDVGKGIVTGIWDGIKSGWDWLKNMVSSNMDSLLAWVKQKLGIKSPSKLFRLEVGEPVGQGIGLGIADGMQAAISGMARMTGTPALAPIIANGGRSLRQLQVGRIEYHGAFSQGELDRLDRRNANATASALLSAFESEERY
jgi:hypothetical protein